MSGRASEIVPARVPRRTWGRFGFVAVCAVLAAAGALAFAYQWKNGIGVTGKRQPVMWGVYITSFAFWTGISSAAVLAAAGQWLRTPWPGSFHRCSAAVGLLGLAVGALFPIIHLGRPWDFYFLLPLPNERMLSPNFASPLMADVFSLNAGLAAMALFLFLSLLPGFAAAREKARGPRRWVYGLLSLFVIPGERGERLLGRALRFVAVPAAMAALLVPVTVALDFARTVNATWHSPLFVPCFVLGAGFSGAAMVLLVWLAGPGARRAEETGVDPTAGLLRWTGAAWFAVAAAEYGRIAWTGTAHEKLVLRARVAGEFAPLFAVMVMCLVLVPASALFIRRFRARKVLVAAAALVVAGMWIERFLTIVPALANPRLSFMRGNYKPSWVEIAIAAGAAGLFGLLWSAFVAVDPATGGNAAGATAGSGDDACTHSS